MKKLIITILSLCLSLITVISVGGCDNGSGNGGENKNPTSNFVDDFDPNKQYNITFFGWGDAKEQNIYQRVIKDFEKVYPNVKVDYEATSAGSYLAALATRINDLPDVFYMPDTEYLQYVASGRLLNVKGGVDEEELNKVWDSAVNEYYYNPSTYQLGKSEGAGLFALPKDLGPYTLGYNKKLVQQRISANGLENDVDVKAVFSGEVYTWDTFISAMKKLLKGTTGIYGVPYYELEHAVYSNNAQFFNEDATQSMITSEPFVKSLEFISTLAKEKIIPDTGVTGVGATAYESFYSGKSLMTFVGPWDFATIWSMNDFEVDIITKLDDVIITRADGLTTFSLSLSLEQLGNASATELRFYLKECCENSGPDFALYAGDMKYNYTTQLGDPFQCTNFATLTVATGKVTTP